MVLLSYKIPFLYITRIGYKYHHDAFAVKSKPVVSFPRIICIERCHELGPCSFCTCLN